MKRMDALKVLVELTPELPVVVTLAATSRELAALADRPNHLYMLDAMGLTPSVATGLALSVAGSRVQKVVALEGDGSLLMNFGALATIGYLKPEQLLLIVLDNGVYASTADIPTYTQALDLAPVAESLGIKTRTAADEASLRGAVQAALAEPGPHFLHVRIEPGNTPGTPLLLSDPVVLAARFSDWLNKAMAGQGDQQEASSPARQQGAEETGARPTYEDTVKLIRSVFEDIVVTGIPRPFGSPAAHLQGMSDGNEGVQWSTWIEWGEPESERAFVAVNLEGLTYENWPVARLIERELRQPTLLQVRGQVDRPEEIEVCWRRDAWQGPGVRSPIAESDLAPTPIKLINLDTTSWRRALLGAQACLASPHGGRAKQVVTQMQGPVTMEVSPHLQFRKQILWPTSRDTFREDLRAARAQLQPLYDFARHATR